MATSTHAQQPGPARMLRPTRQAQQAAGPAGPASPAGRQAQQAQHGSSRPSRPSRPSKLSKSSRQAQRTAQGQEPSQASPARRLRRGFLGVQSGPGDQLGVQESESNYGSRSVLKAIHLCLRTPSFGTRPGEPKDSFWVQASTPFESTQGANWGVGCSCTEPQDGRPKHKRMVFRSTDIQDVTL